MNRNLLFRFAPQIIIGLFVLTLPTFASLPFVSLFTKIFIFGLLVMSLDLVVGYTGLWSFCHAALFGVAAYTTGILITEFNITYLWFTAPISILVAALIAAIVGLIALRTSFVYFLLVTFALGQLVYGVVIRLKDLTGGGFGLPNIPYPNFGFDWYSPVGMYYFVLVIFMICAFALYRIIKSPFGISLQGIRENQLRMRALGYNTWLFKYVSFVISGAFAGVAGILFAYYNGLVTPENLDVTASGLLWLMLIIGGTGTLWGGLLGSFVILFLQYEISLFTPERWPLILGAVFIASVMYLHGGIFPYLSNLWDRVRKLYVKS